VIGQIRQPVLLEQRYDRRVAAPQWGISNI
jgi:hypothetical protein